VLFDGALIDGTLLGADFGTQFDKDYGFMGLFSPDVEIASALLFTELDFQFQVDDLHFGVIPEPTTMMLLFTGLVALATTHGRLRLFRRRTIRMTLIIVAASFPAARGSEVISGTVTGWVDLTAGPICGVIQPPQCTNPALSL